VPLVLEHWPSPRPNASDLSMQGGRDHRSVYDGGNGITRVCVTVNGDSFELAGFGVNEVRGLDVSSAMVAGNDAMTGTGLGKPGARATALMSS
jgi:hypothetical protein